MTKRSMGKSSESKLQFPNLIGHSAVVNSNADKRSQLQDSTEDGLLQNTDIDTDRFEVETVDTLAKPDTTKVNSGFNPNKFYFINRNETIFAAIGAFLLLVFGTIVIISAINYTPTKQDIKTYGKNVRSILTTAAYEHAGLWILIAIFLFVATFFIKRRAPLIVGAVLAAFALGLITPYGLIYIGLAVLLAYNAYKIKQETPVQVPQQKVPKVSSGILRKASRLFSKQQDKPIETIAETKSIPKPSSRYTPPKQSSRKK